MRRHPGLRAAGQHRDARVPDRRARRRRRLDAVPCRSRSVSPLLLVLLPLGAAPDDRAEVAWPRGLGGDHVVGGRPGARRSGLGVPRGPGHGPDPVNGFPLLRDAYLATDPTFDGHVSVPALWDRTTNQLVSNHYTTMTIDLETQFAECADPTVDLRPAALHDEIHELNTEIVRPLATAGLRGDGRHHPGRLRRGQ